jgi:hypothetical protein
MSLLRGAHHPLGFEHLTLEEDWERYRELLEDLEWRDHSSLEDNPHNDDRDNSESPPPSCLLAVNPNDEPSSDIRTQPMPQTELPPVFPTRPLNLNPDGTPINYRKSHSGPHAAYWAKAHREEIERLFVTGTIKYCASAISPQIAWSHT